jgi:hypothetical protein
MQIKRLVDSRIKTSFKNIEVGAVFERAANAAQSSSLFMKILTAFDGRNAVTLEGVPLTFLENDQVMEVNGEFVEK